MIKRDLIKHVLRKSPGETVSVGGWIRTRGDSKGGFSFLEVNDGSCFANLQLVANQDLANYESEILKLYPGASILATGKLVASPGKGQAVELVVEHLTVTGIAIQWFIRWASNASVLRSCVKLPTCVPVPIHLGLLLAFEMQWGVPFTISSKVAIFIIFMLR